MKLGTLFGIVLAVLAVVMLTTPVPADDQGETHEGTVVSVSATKLVMKDTAGKEHTHNLGTAVSFSLDGKQAKSDDLRPGMKIRVTTKKGDPNTVLRIEAIDKNKDFPKDQPK